MYTENIYQSDYHIEHEFSYLGETGSKTDTRAEKKRTPEEIRRANNAHRAKVLRRTIQLNFRPGDLLITLKYPRGERPGIEKLKVHFAKFRRGMKKQYKKQGKEMKYIYRFEIGKMGGVHAHVIMNRIDGALEIMTKAWQKARGVTAIEDMVAADSTELPELVTLDGKVDLRLLYMDGGYRELADYLCKALPGEIEGTLTKEEKKEFYAYGSSRNLKRPEPIRKKYAHWTMKRILEAGPEKINTDPALRKRYLHPGFLIDKSTWETGVNPVTGKSFLYYTEVRAT